MNIFWTLDKPVVSVSTCYVERVAWGGNLVKYLFNASLQSLQKKHNFKQFYNV